MRRFSLANQGLAANIGAGAWQILSNYFLPAVVLVALGGLWELLSAKGVLNPLLIPAPSQVISALIQHREELGFHSWITIQEVLLGYVIGFGLGFTLGIALAYSRLLERALHPLLVVSQNLPHIALGPIIIVWLGYGMQSKLAMVALITFFPVTMSVIDGLRSIDPELLRFVRSLGATEWQMFQKVKFPHSLPYLFTGIKVSATYGVLAAVVGEWIGSRSGLGNLMMKYHLHFQEDTVFASIAIMTLIGIIMFAGAVGLERLLIPWGYAKRRQH